MVTDAQQEEIDKEEDDTFTTMLKENQRTRIMRDQRTAVDAGDTNRKGLVSFVETTLEEHVVPLFAIHRRRASSIGKHDKDWPSISKNTGGHTDVSNPAEPTRKRAPSIGKHDKERPFVTMNADASTEVAASQGKAL
jgi:hypothetical protein